MRADGKLGWLGIIRLGLVQTALGAIVVLTTSTLNRVMVVELALPAMLPGALVGWHYAVQLSRPRWGYGADAGNARTPWIIGGVGVLALGGIGAALSTALMASDLWLGVAASAFSFLLVGVGVGASGTNLLALLANRTHDDRKAAAAAIVWIMMIMGFVVTAGVAGAFLDPFSMKRLVYVTAVVCLIAFVVAGLAMLGIERKALPSLASDRTRDMSPPDNSSAGFWKAMRDTWADTQARRFTVFIFVSMLAYSAQDLILEPFAGLVYGYTPGESTKLAGVQNGGVLLGMIATAIIGSTIGKSRAGFMRIWTMAGCVASAVSLGLLAFGALIGPSWPLQQTVFALGVSNGAFAVAAIGSMMALANAGGGNREGTRMGLWGASQAMAFGAGGFLGAISIDIARAVIGETPIAFGFVFAVEGAAFLVAAWLAARVGATASDSMRLPVMPTAEQLSAE